MRVNVYTEELPTGLQQASMCEIVTADYVSCRTGLSMTNYGLRIFLKSAPELHYIEGRDDDRSAVTFWCGSSKKNVMNFIKMLESQVVLSLGDLWRDATTAVQRDAEASEYLRNVTDYDGKPSVIETRCVDGHRLDYPNQICNLCLGTMGAGNLGTMGAGNYSDQGDA